MIKKTSSYEKCAWPATGIKENTAIEDYDWGYLYFYHGDRMPDFRIDEKPSNPEIRQRWGHYLSRAYSAPT